MSLMATITNITRGSLHDGPGVRSVVYFKGCGLRCKWCHNPETLSAKKEILYTPQKCIGCGRCIDECPEHHFEEGGRILFSVNGCIACGRCAKVCPTSALCLCGEEISTEKLFFEINKDVHYFKKSGGGVTFSGGECLLYSDFIAEIEKRCCENNIHTAIETALFVPWENIEKVLLFTDLFFVDLKISNTEKHKKFTSQDNNIIMENIMKLSQIHKNIILRIPVIPSVNDSEKDIIGFAKSINCFGKGITKVELLKYNNLAEEKYNLCFRKYTKFSEAAQTNEEMNKICASLANKIDVPCCFI